MIQTWFLFYMAHQGSFLVPLLFLTFINNLTQAVKFCKSIILQMTLTYFNKNNSKTKHVNRDILVQWLNTSKISLNVQTTEMMIFKHQKKLDVDKGILNILVLKLMKV